MSQWQQTLDLLELCIGKLQSQAPVAAISELRQFLPVSSDHSYRLVLIELIKLDLAAAAEAGLDRRLDDYLTEFAAEIPRDQVPPDMILEELQVLGDSGITPDITEYIQRFPHLAAVLQHWQGGLQHVQTLRQFAPPKNLNTKNVQTLPIGALIEDFRILRCVGQGAFASVYLALQETLQRLVALKVSSRSSEESQTLSQLDHPNIVRVYDERNLNNPPARLLYMQFVGGGTLGQCVDDVAAIPVESRRGSDLLKVIAQRLNQYGLEPPPHLDSEKLLHQLDWPATVAWIGVQLCEGLDYAHRKSVIHRDIKPANILLAADGTPRLADFNVSYSGIAGRAGAAAYFGGSLAYMSPEQLEIVVSSTINTDEPSPTSATISRTLTSTVPHVSEASALRSTLRAEDLDGRSDLFSLGVVLYEILHNSRPWHLDGMPKSWTDAMKNELDARRRPVEPGTVATVFENHPVFKVLDQTIRECLALDRSERPATGAKLKEKLKLALHPKAASRIFPAWRPWVQKVGKLPPWLVLTIGSLVPNLIAAVFNFAYNNSQIVARYPDLWPTFVRVATWVNSLFFPLGVGLTMYLIVKHSRNITSHEPHRDRPPASRKPSDPFWNLGHQVALICGGLWFLAGLIFPALLLANDQSFRWSDALHFFSSLTICGGVAMVYPFFWITWMNLMLYYPRTVARNLGELDIDGWGPHLRRMARKYLMTAAAIPLIALVLLAVTDDIPRHYLLATILTTAAGFAASVVAVQYIDDYVQDLQM